MARYTVGVDFGTESGRAVVVDVADGRVARRAASGRTRTASSTRTCRRRTRTSDSANDWALQDPDDYIATFRHAVPAALAESGVDPADVVGIGIDFTACTMLPTLADGTPLSRLPELRREPHAWVKLWKHHAAQPEADRINAVAGERGEPWLPRYGGKISSEWFFAKALQILDEAPDGLPRRRTGSSRRPTGSSGSSPASRRATAARPATRRSGRARRASHPRTTSPRSTPASPGVVDEKMSRTVVPIGSARRRADRGGGGLDRAPTRDGRRGRQRRRPRLGAGGHGHGPRPDGRGHGHEHLPSACSASGRRSSRACAGSSRTASCRASSASRRASRRSATSSPGSPTTSCRPSYHREAERDGIDLHAVLEREAARLAPGESGLLALDWWNGNRSVLVDTDLSGC